MEWGRVLTGDTKMAASLRGRKWVLMWKARAEYIAFVPWLHSPALFARWKTQTFQCAKKNMLGCGAWEQQPTNYQVGNCIVAGTSSTWILLLNYTNIKS